MPLLRLLQNIFEPVISFVLPAHCVLCEKPLAANRRVVCHRCFDALPVLSSELIKSLEDEIEVKYFDRLFIPYQYSKPFQELIHLFKYKRFLSVSKYMAEGLAKIIPVEKYNLVTCVPLNVIKERERGYNQSALLAGYTARFLHCRYSRSLIVRTKNTVTQTKLSRQNRIENVSDAFQCDSDLSGMSILLIDDVITTGSTLNACAKVLKKQGAAGVDIAALATPANYLQENLEKATKDLNFF